MTFASTPGSTRDDGLERKERGKKSAEERANDLRSSLVESPATRIRFKDFYRTFKKKEREANTAAASTAEAHDKAAQGGGHRGGRRSKGMGRGAEVAREYALSVLEKGLLPEKVHWRVILELADLSKRENQFGEARRLFAKVNEMQVSERRLRLTCYFVAALLQAYSLQPPAICFSRLARVCEARGGVWALAAVPTDSATWTHLLSAQRVAGTCASLDLLLPSPRHWHS